MIILVLGYTVEIEEIDDINTIFDKVRAQVDDPETASDIAMDAAEAVIARNYEVI